MSLLKSSENITVGKDTYYNGDIKLVASPSSKISIGNYCAIGSNLKIITLNHDYNYPAIQGKFYRKYFGSQHPGEKNTIPTTQRTKGDVNIGSDVWIGDDVAILSGVKIGNGCCIGTKSVVTKDLPPYSICGGIPCIPLKYRYNDEIIKQLQNIRWWEWSDEKIKKNKFFFNLNMNNVKNNDITSQII